jgi:hypothetical protein
MFSQRRGIFQLSLQLSTLLSWLTLDLQVSSVMGGGMGFLFGGFMNSMEMRPYDHGRPMLALAKEFGKEYVKAGFSMAKNFAIIGGIYQVSECGLEKIRAKTDIYNRCFASMCMFSSSIVTAFAVPWQAALRGASWLETLDVQVCFISPRPKVTCSLCFASLAKRQ